MGRSHLKLSIVEGFLSFEKERKKIFSILFRQNFFFENMDLRL